jgi:hypothetical protein
MAYGEIIGNGNPDGSALGIDANSLVGMHGLAVAQQALTAAVTTVAATTAGSPYGFTTAAQAAAIIELLNLIRIRLIAKGIMSA